MTKAEAFAKIVSLFKKENFNDAKLINGDLIQWEGELAVGIPINLIDTDGNTMPIADGVYEMEDGSELYTVGGMVTQIEPKEVEMATVDVTEQMAALEDRMAKCESMMAEYKSKMEAAFATYNDAVEAKFSEVKEIVEAIAEEPIVPQAKPTNTTFKAVELTTAQKLHNWKTNLNK